MTKIKKYYYISLYITHLRPNLGINKTITFLATISMECSKTRYNLKDLYFIGCYYAMLAFKGTNHKHYKIDQSKSKSQD